MDLENVKTVSDLTEIWTSM